MILVQIAMNDISVNNIREQKKKINAIKKQQLICKLRQDNYPNNPFKISVRLPSYFRNWLFYKTPSNSHNIVMPCNDPIEFFFQDFANLFKLTCAF